MSTMHHQAATPDARDAAPAAASAPGAHGSTAVFADPTGRRWRVVRVVSAFLALTLIAAVVLLVSQAGRPPGRPDALAAAPLAAQDVGRPPVIGTGPLTRVLRLDRSAAVVGVEPFTGERIALTAEEVAELAELDAGASTYVIQRYGYAPGATRTMSLTYDDGPSGNVTPQLLDLLSSKGVPATFFVVGDAVARQPAVVERMAREGHAVGIHTLTHVSMSDVPAWRAVTELVATDRALRAVTGHAAALWRMPYDSPAAPDMQDNVEALLRGQRLGYAHGSYEFDTRDWWHEGHPGGQASDIPLPDLSDGGNVTVLLHDAGGPNRQWTVAYTARLIEHARAHGYTFATMPQANAAVAASTAPVQASLWDHLTFYSVELLYRLPELAMRTLFVASVLLTVVLGLFHTALAVWRRRRRSAMVWPHPSEMAVRVSVVLAAYNEEPVIERTLRSILASDYPIKEVVVVDDGSSDGTADVVARVQRTQLVGRVVLVRQPNTGKARALNHGIERARGDVIVTLDADTVIRHDTVTNLVRHFALDGAERLGAVAGVVRVGNRRRNLLTRWQSLEYLTQIGLDRAAQDALGAIPIIPGACAAWRKTAILGAGGYSSVTLAEDCDLSLVLSQQGWRVTQDDEAVAYTEVPENVDALLKQRVRWTYGTLQAIHKNRRMILRRGSGALGHVVLPLYLASILIPLVFLPLMVVTTVHTLEHAPVTLVAYFAAFLLVQVVLAAVAIWLMGEKWSHLLMVPVYRIIYEPLRGYLLYKSIHLAVRGGREGWNKLDRSGSLDERAALKLGLVRLPLSAAATRTAVTADDERLVGTTS